MSSFFLDSSALAKRYLTETGSSWILEKVSLALGNSIVVVEITRVEVAAAIAARQRAPKGISRQERDGIIALLLKHFEQEYQIVTLTPDIIGQAVELTQNYRLRGYDAVQLAAAIAINQSLDNASLPGLTFVAADSDLLLAAEQEGLSVENPNDHGQ
jgi:uncharacterized protein